MKDEISKPVAARISGLPETPAEDLARVKRWSREHRPARLAYMRAWAKANPDKLRRSRKKRQHQKNSAGGRVIDAQWVAVNDAFGWRCLRCGVKHSESPVTKDHVVPLSRGGAHCIENIQPLCDACNRWKHAKVVDFRPAYPREYEAARDMLRPLKGLRKSPPSTSSRLLISQALTGYRHTAESREKTRRGVTRAWEKRGARKDSSSGVRGVIWDSESQMWRARVTRHGKRVYLGRFDTISEASAAISEFKESNTAAEGAEA